MCIERLVSVSDDERTTAQGLFNTADAYLRSASIIFRDDSLFAFKTLTIIFPLNHAIELYLKCGLRLADCSVADLKKVGHRLSLLAERWYECLPVVLSPKALALVAYLESEAIGFRYLVTGTNWQPSVEEFANVALELRSALVGFCVNGQSVVHKDEAAGAWQDILKGQ